MTFSITNISDVLFLDIETVPVASSFDKLSSRRQSLWDKKSQQWRKDATPKEAYDKAGIYAEFGKIVCITVGNISKGKLYIKSYAGDDERVLLRDFQQGIEKFCKRKSPQLCAHNGKEFDFPYICRRMLINGLELPKILQVQGKKPWEIPFLDTLELWRFGDYKNYTSLDLLCEVFDIPTPKDDIDGSMVASVYWQEQELERIVSYCEKDVISLVRLYQRLQSIDMISDEEISFL